MNQSNVAVLDSLSELLSSLLLGAFPSADGVSLEWAAPDSWLLVIHMDEVRMGVQPSAARPEEMTLLHLALAWLYRTQLPYFGVASRGNDRRDTDRLIQSLAVNFARQRPEWMRFTLTERVLHVARMAPFFAEDRDLSLALIDNVYHQVREG